VSESTPVISVRDLRKSYRVGGGLGRDGGEVRALDGITAHIDPGTALGVVGESGCGKSTLARCMAALITPSAGEVRFDGVALSQLDRGSIRRFRRDVQMIFQNPSGSLNPRRRIGETIAAPLAVHGIGNSAARRRRVAEMLERVGLAPRDAARYPSEFSGGQQQRIGIARALVLQPRVLIADEPVSALDVSVQSQVLNLLSRLKGELDLSLLFISHDLGVIRQVSDQVAVMYLGKIVENADVDALFVRPRHPYTDALISSAPIPNPEANAQRQRHLAEGELPSPLDPPPGCTFNPRCPRATELCTRVAPDLEPHAPGHGAACHHPLSVRIRPPR
jgi:oligopeptide transport system ATP-binding protein